MKKYLIAAIFGLTGVLLQGQNDSVYFNLTLDDAIGLAREQSPMAIMARHQFRSSYWEYRTYKASFLPSLNSVIE